VTEFGYDEIHEAIVNMEFVFLWIMLIGVGSVAVTAWFFGQMISKRLIDIMGILDKSSKTVTDLSIESEAAATELSSAATEQAASLQETMASVEEISAMISQNSESSTQAQDIVNVNGQSSKDGLNAVEEMVQSIDQIKVTNENILNQMEESNKEFAEIVRIISAIGEKTKVINDIVFQTKLLSFNASVEAARAGEHGKGFAVVAEEVGNLAQMSGNAAKEITEMLSGSITRGNSIVDQTKTKVEELVEVGKDKVTMGQTTAEKCSVILNKLAESATQLTRTVTEIVQASKEQSVGVKEINTAISQLDQVTQQNSAVAQQSSIQAETLLNETTVLKNVITQLSAFVHGKAAPGAAVDSIAPKKSLSSKVVNNVVKMERKKFEGPAVSKMAVGSDLAPQYDEKSFEKFQ
jgi:methyl-accepting chemotaxis protein